MPSTFGPSLVQQARNILSQVIQLIRTETENLQPVLTQEDCKGWLDAEKCIRDELKKIATSQSNTGVLSWIWVSPQEKKALQDAQELLTSIKDTIDQRSRERIRQNLAVRGSMAISSANNPSLQPDSCIQTADVDPHKPSAIVTSPLNMQYGEANVPGANIPLASFDSNDYLTAMSEAINTPLGDTWVKRDDVSDIGESPSHGDLDSTTASAAQQPAEFYTAPSTPQSPLPDNPSKSSAPHTKSRARRPPPPPPPPKQVPVQQRRKFGRYIQATNCVDIIGGTADGLTLNYGGTGNTGSVIHRTVLPRSSHFQPQVPHF